MRPQPKGRVELRGGLVLVRERHFLRRVDRAEERPAAVHRRLDLLGGQLRAALGAGSLYDRLVGVLLEVHAAMLALRLRPWMATASGPPRASPAGPWRARSCARRPPSAT